MVLGDSVHRKVYDGLSLKTEAKDKTLTHTITEVNDLDDARDYNENKSEFERNVGYVVTPEEELINKLEFHA